MIDLKSSGHITFVVNTFGRGGAELSLAILAKELAKAGVVVTYVAVWREEKCYDFVELTNLGIEIVTLFDKKPFVLIGLYRLFKIIKRDRPKLIFSAMLYSNTICQAVSTLLGVRHIASVRTNPASFYKNNPFKLLFFSVLLLMQTSVVFISKRSLREYLKTGYGRILHNKKIEVLHNPIVDTGTLNLNFLRAKVKRTQNKVSRIINGFGIHEKHDEIFVIGIISRLVNGKGVLETLNMLTPQLKYGKMHLKIYGSGYLENEVVSLIEGSKNTRAIFFEGHKTNLKDVYDEIDLLIFPSENEGFGRVPFEAYISGCLVLCNEPSSHIDEFVDSPHTWKTYTNSINLRYELPRFFINDVNLATKQIEHVSKLLAYDTHAQNFIKCLKNLS